MERAIQDRTTAEKLELLDLYKTVHFLSQREAAERLGITKGFLQILIKNKAVIRVTVAAAEPSSSKVKRKSQEKMRRWKKLFLIDLSLFVNRNAAVNGPIFMDKAIRIVEASEHTNFKAAGG